MTSSPISYSPGPRTIRGRARSSANAALHGLLAHHLLLPGEDEDHFREHLVGWISSCRPSSFAEARVAAELADLDWKLGRLRRAEHAAIFRNVETAMTMNPRYCSLTGLKQASTALDALLGGLQFGLERDPLPSDTRGLEPLVLGTRSVLKILEDIDAISAERELLGQQLLAMEIAAATSMAGRPHLVALQETARTIREKIEINITEARTEIEMMRDKLLAEMPLPIDVDGKKLARYRAQIENSMSRLLDVLGKTKSLSKKSKKTGDARRGSFGSGNSGPTVTLRVLK